MGCEKNTAGGQESGKRFSFIQRKILAFSCKVLCLEVRITEGKCEKKLDPGGCA